MVAFRFGSKPFNRVRLTRERIREFHVSAASILTPSLTQAPGAGSIYLVDCPWKKYLHVEFWQKLGFPNLVQAPAACRPAIGAIEVKVPFPILRDHEVPYLSRVLAEVIR